MVHHISDHTQTDRSFLAAEEVTDGLHRIGRVLVHPALVAVLAALDVAVLVLLRTGIELSRGATVRKSVVHMVASSRA